MLDLYSFSPYQKGQRREGRKHIYLQNTRILNLANPMYFSLKILFRHRWNRIAVPQGTLVAYLYKRSYPVGVSKVALNVIMEQGPSMSFMMT